jgi:DMSO reductase anchor subunit
VASFFHLGHPERAWRAAAKWRTSWLSREVIVLPAFMGVVFLYGLAHWLDWHPVLMTLPGGLPVDPSAILGVAGTVLAFALFVCTAMIYACLKFLAEWHSPLTVINYILLGGASGFTLAAAFAAATAPELVGFLAGWAAIITLLGLLSRGASLVSQRPAQAEIDAADRHRHQASEDRAEDPGLHGRQLQHPRVLSWQAGAVLRGVKWFFLLACFRCRFGCCWPDAGRRRPCWCWPFAMQYCGLLAERWFFFAQANHPQNLYYQSIA